MSVTRLQSCEGNVSRNTGSDVIRILTMTSLHQRRHTVSGNVSYPGATISGWLQPRIRLNRPPIGSGLYIQEYNLPYWPCVVIPEANAQSMAAMMVVGVNWFILSTDISGLN